MHQQISDQESSYFPVPGRIQERKRIIGQDQDFFQPEAERVRSYDPEPIGPAKRSMKKQQTVVNTSNELRSTRIRNDISTQITKNVVIPEITISSNTLWLQFPQFVEKLKKILRDSMKIFQGYRRLIPYKPKLFILFKRTIIN
ncbi:hypothetical protein O181_062176 [Austropuccinia psidii MF-1]|uniref:Uncharacterized protein n=1 Tax=Austropuccinia psidii MF-1 TaxID=1389203 RepID=A0A9Q3HY78_9BASI|nr:hypothetical protein [Austropuccinia psidii MF-1]